MKERGKFDVEEIKKPHILEIPVPFYKLTVLVAWESPIMEVFEYAKKQGCDLSKEWIDDHLSVSEGGNGCCSNLGPGNTDVLIWLRNSLSRSSRASEFGVLYHELFHAVDRITETHKLDGERECRAYIFEYLVNECNAFFWTRKDKK